MAVKVDVVLLLLGVLDRLPPVPPPRPTDAGRISAWVTNEIGPAAEVVFISPRLRLDERLFG